MSAVAVMFIAMAIADACRLTRVAWLPLAAGPMAVVAVAALTGLWHLGDVPLLVIAAAACVGWVLLYGRAERTGEHEAGPLALVMGAVGVLILLSGWGSGVDGLVARWSEWAGIDGVDADRLLMIVGVVLLQLLTGNQLVRLVLGSVGAVRPAGVPQPSDRLKGGKARENGNVGIDDVTEYFLVGSFASWILALGGLALVLSQ